jgi:hypothetical protein
MRLCAGKGSSISVNETTGTAQIFRLNDQANDISANDPAAHVLISPIPVTLHIPHS